MTNRIKAAAPMVGFVTFDDDEDERPEGTEDLSEEDLEEMSVETHRKLTPAELDRFTADPGPTKTQH